MRPQFGSCPYIAAFVSEDAATDFAASRASSSDCAPTHLTCIKHVAPSPSQATDFASPCKVAVSAPSSFAPDDEDASVMVGLPAAPDASPSTVSFVDVSPSTVICNQGTGHFAHWCLCVCAQLHAYLVKRRCVMHSCRRCYDVVTCRSN